MKYLAVCNRGLPPEWHWQWSELCLRVCVSACAKVSEPSPQAYPRTGITICLTLKQGITYYTHRAPYSSCEGYYIPGTRTVRLDKGLIYLAATLLGWRRLLQPCSRNLLAWLWTKSNCSYKSWLFLSGSSVRPRHTNTHLGKTPLILHHGRQIHI